ncbi:MAG TPA: hypothetical protein VGB25_01925 [Candidatus Binatia bacterium]
MSQSSSEMAKEIVVALVQRLESVNNSDFREKAEENGEAIGKVYTKVLVAIRDAIQPVDRRD